MADIRFVPKVPRDEVLEALRDNFSFEEFLFFRTGADELDQTAKVWEFECSACGAHWLSDKRGIKPSELEFCPRCGEWITPRKWRDRRPLDSQKCTLQLWKRDGRRLWLLGYYIFRGPDIEWTVSLNNVVCYDDGGAQRWARKWAHDPHIGRGCWHWEPIKAINHWYEFGGGLGMYRYRLDDVIVGLDREDVAGTCLEYSQGDKAAAAGADLVRYFDDYLKHPQLEYFVRQGFGWAMRDRYRLGGGAFSRVFNIRGKSMKSFFRGMGKADIKQLRQMGDLEQAALYCEMRKANAIDANENGRLYAQAAQLQGRMDWGTRELHKYILRQARRDAGAATFETMRHTMQLLTDYRLMCRALRIAPGLPDRLVEEHDRLAERQRRLESYGGIEGFRLRRHLLRRLSWHRGGLLIRPIDSPQEIIREGEMQHNCVAGYRDAHAKGRTNIFVIRRREDPRQPFVTVEYNYGQNSVRQCYAAKNRNPPAEVNDFVDAWLARNEEVMRS